jgi:ATP-dependent DNA helicase HFM1/MER3
LAEHLNSEIGLGTIKDVSTAKDWLKTSFLFQRIQKNPDHYLLKKGERQTWQERVDDLVVQGLEKLKGAELIECDGKLEVNGNETKLTSTEYGDIMSKVRAFALSIPGLTLASFISDRPR